MTAIVVKLTLVAVIWGGTFIAGRVAAPEMSAPTAAVPLRSELGLPHVSSKAWIAIVYMGTLGTAVAFVLFLEGVQQLGPARAAIFVNLVPVAAIALGALLLGEKITAPMLAGAALVVAGVWIINQPPATTPAPACAHPH